MADKLWESLQAGGQPGRLPILAGNLLRSRKDYAANPSTAASAGRPRIMSDAFSAIIIVDA